MFSAFKIASPKDSPKKWWEYLIPGRKLVPFDRERAVFHEFEEKVPYRDLVENYIVDVYGCVIAFFDVQAPAADVATADLLINIQRTLALMVEGLPPNILQIEFHFATSGDYREMIAKHLAYPGQWEIEQLVRKRRAEFLIKEQKERRLVRSSTTMVMVCGPKKEMKEGSSIWTQFQNLKPGSRKADARLPKIYLREIEFKQARSTLETAASAARDQLQRVGITLRTLSATEVATYLYRLWNPDHAIDYNRPINFDPDETPLNDAWMCSEIFLRDNCLRWGNYFHGIVSMNRKPQETMPRAIEALTQEMQFSDYRVSLFVQRTDREHEITTLKGKRKRALGMMKLGMDALAHLNKENKRGDGMGHMNIEARDEIDDSNDLISRLRRKKTYLAKVQMAVHLWHQDRRELLDRFELTANAMGNMGKALPWKEAHSLWPVMLSTLPGAFTNFARPQKVEGTMAADLMAIHRGFEGGGDPVAILHNATRGLIGVDLFDTDLKAPMAFISGATGSGKSVLANNLIMQHMIGEEKPLLIILDVGKSYEPFVELMGGKMITFDKDNPKCLNPLQIAFSASETLEEPSKADLIRMLSCVEIMIGLDQVPPEKANLYSIILQDAIAGAFYEAVSANEQFVRLTRVQDVIREWIYGGRGEAATELVNMLAPFTQGGVYEQWFDGAADIDMDSEIICFDLQGLGEGSVLQRAVIPILINYINDMVCAEAYKGRRKIIVMDELWRLINTPKMASFIALAWKTYRKEYAALIGISQNLVDACQSNPVVANALLQNTYMWFLMNQGEESNRAYAINLLNLSEGQAEILGTLREKNEITADGRIESYREGLIIRRTATNDSGRFRVRLLPEEYWISTTQAKERAYRQITLDKFDGNLSKTIEYLAGRHPGGLLVKKSTI